MSCSADTGRQSPAFESPIRSLWNRAMPPRMPRSRSIVPLGTAATLALAAALLSAPGVLAECDGPVPSFREHATSADRVVIGRVTAVDAGSPWRDEQGAFSRFTLRVQHAVRGPFESTMTLRDLAYLECSDHILMARKGDRIALALGISAFGQRINTAAWIDGPPFPFAERISEPEVFALFRLRPPDTSTTPPDANPEVSWVTFPAVLAGLLGGLLAYARTGVRPRNG